MVNLSDAGRKDPSMLGGTHYPRNPLDHYPTPPRATNAFVSVVEDDLEAMQVWEPFCGDGAISNILTPYCRNFGSTDIVAYEGFDPAGLIDFFNVYPEGEKHEIAVAAWEKVIDDLVGEEVAEHMKRNDGSVLIAGVGEHPPRPLSMSDVEALLGFRPDAIITNPPYGKDAVRALEKALELMEPEKGYVSFLMRHEWDAAKGRAKLIDHPAFMAKITLRFRPLWVKPKEGEKPGSPRFSFAWFCWDWIKAHSAPNARPEMYFAG